MQHLDGLKPERFGAIEDALARPQQHRCNVEREFMVVRSYSCLLPSLRLPYERRRVVA